MSQPTTQPIEDAAYSMTKVLAEIPLSKGILWRSLIGTAEVGILKAALDLCAGNQTEAAELLGVSRTTFRERMARYDLSGCGK